MRMAPERLEHERVRCGVQIALLERWQMRLRIQADTYNEEKDFVSCAPR